MVENRRDVSESGAPVRSDTFSDSCGIRRASLEAIHRLEAALGSAAPGREEAWSDIVGGALRAVEAALDTRDNYDGIDDNPLSTIVRSQCQFEHRVSQLRRDYTSLRRELAAAGLQCGQRPPDFADRRHRIYAALAALRHYHARETDLILEAWDTDTGAMD